MRMGTKTEPFRPRFSSPPSAAAIEKDPWPIPVAEWRKEGAVEEVEGWVGSRGWGIETVAVSWKMG